MALQTHVEGKYLIVTEYPVDHVGTILADDMLTRKCDVMVMLHDGSAESADFLQDMVE